MKVDKQRAMELYNGGLNDVEIAKELKCDRHTICDWRQKNNLAHQHTTPTKINYTKVKELYDVGLNDKEISNELKCSSVTIGKWRKHNCLSPNRKPYKNDRMCKILKNHANELKHDENRLSTEFINMLINTNCED